jgi:glucose-6-phosphate-specific signal transduction histidine kinase
MDTLKKHILGYAKTVVVTLILSCLCAISLHSLGLFKNEHEAELTALKLSQKHTNEVLKEAMQETKQLRDSLLVVNAKLESEIYEREKLNKALHKKNETTKKDIIAVSALLPNRPLL